jgi:hypothetical protein
MLLATGADFGGVMSGPWFGRIFLQFLSLVHAGDHACGVSLL